MGNNVRQGVGGIDAEGRSVGNMDGRIEGMDEIKKEEGHGVGKSDELLVGLTEGITRIEGCEDGARVGFIVG